MIPNEFVPLHKCFKDVRAECDAYALDMGSLRTSAARLVDAATGVASEAHKLGAHDMATRFEVMSACIAETRDKLAELHRVAVALADSIAGTKRDFELMARKVK